jgi:hypothetical protein
MILPGGFLHAGNFSAVNGFTQAKSAHAKFTVDAMNSATSPTSALNAGGELRWSGSFDDEGFTRHN